MFVRAQLAGDLMDEKVRDKAIPGLGMNGLGVQAEALAERVGSEATDEGRVTKAFEIVFQRPPSAEELKASIEFMHSPELLQAASAQPEYKNVVMEKPASAAAKPPKESPLKSLCWALLSSTEFLYIN
jgi:hypothetical protein